MEQKSSLLTLAVARSEMERGLKAMVDHFGA
jgi:hypothetical protein